jgi:hypothetical protein
MATQQKPKSISDKIIELVAQDHKEAMIEYEAMVDDPAACRAMPIAEVRAKLYRAYPAPSDPDDRDTKPERKLEADLKRAETRREMIADVATADSLADEKAELQTERRNLIQNLQDKLQPIEVRLREIEAKEQQKSRATEWLKRFANLPKCVQREYRQISKQLQQRQRFIETSIACVNADDRDLIRRVDQGDGRHSWSAWPGVDAAAAQAAIARTKAAEAQLEQRREVARREIERLEKKVDRLMAFAFVMVPTAEMIEEALRDESADFD